MNIDSLLKQQAQNLLEQYKAFEDLKKLAMAQEDVNFFSGYAPDIEDEADGEDDEGEEGDFMQMGYKAAAQWKDYMSMYANGEVPTEAFPASEPLIQSDINPDDPKYASGVMMGIPQMVWVHGPNAGRMIPDLGE